MYNTNREILAEVQRASGGTISAAGQRKEEWKPSYALIWTSAAAAKIIRQMAPHLRVKSRQAALMLRFQEHVRGCQRVRDSAGRLLPFPSGELALRESVYAQLKRLNRRGPPVRLRHADRRLQPVQPQALSPKYLAGFIDAEGSLMIQKVKVQSHWQPQYKPRIAIANTNRAVLEDIQQAYGGILVTQPPRKSEWKCSYQLVWTDGMVERVLLVVAPHLRVKRTQAVLVLDLIRHRRSTRQGRRSRNGFFAPLPKRVMALRERLHRRVKQLNAKGPLPEGRTITRGERKPPAAGLYRPPAFSRSGCPPTSRPSITG